MNLRFYSVQMQMQCTNADEINIQFLSLQEKSKYECYVLNQPQKRKMLRVDICYWPGLILEENAQTYVNMCFCGTALSNF